MTDLTAVDGIADGNVDEIRALDIESAEELADADVDTVAEAKGFGPTKAEDVIEAAGEVVDDSEPDTSSQTVPGVAMVPDEVEYPPSDLTDEHRLENDISFRTRYHAISGLVDRAEQHRRSRRTEKRLAAERALAGFMTDEHPILDEPAWTEVKLALIDEKREWSGVSRLNSITADIRDLTQSVKMIRARLDPNASVEDVQ